MREECLLTSPLEYTNEPYAVAKIAGLKLCESFNLQYGTNFVAVMPTNLYGPEDNFDLETSHVLPALVRKMHLARALMEGIGRRFGEISAVGRWRVSMGVLPSRSYWKNSANTASSPGG